MISMMMNKKEIILPFREHYSWYFEERYLKAMKDDNAAPWMSFNDVFDQSSFLGDNEDYQNFDL